MKPMLCHRYEKYHSQITWPWYGQPKLNGIRLMYQNGVMQSRSYGIPIPRTWPTHRLRHLRAALSNLPPHLLTDGELYVHGWSLQKINGAASINSNNDSERSLLLQYHVFDVINGDDLEQPFSERQLLFPSYRVLTTEPVFFLESTLLQNEADGNAYFEAQLALGYEGAVYKDPNEAYGFAELCGNQENRWKKTLKRKNYLDETCRIVGVMEGDGKYEGMVGSFHLELPNGKRFYAGSGLFDSQRDEYWEHPPLGAYCHVKFLNYSDDGLPKEPVIEAVYE